jgi:hypothetical protein
MTPFEWVSFINGYMLREEDAWQRTRVLYALIYNTNVESRHQKRADELIPLPGDKKYKDIDTGKAARYLTGSEREQLRKKYGLLKG